MTQLHLIIKGNRRDALAAAKQYGITLWYPQTNRRTKSETNATCGDEYRDQVMRWFNEEPREAPYPVGALLHWSEGNK
jgi:hypothetical protein